MTDPTVPVLIVGGGGAGLTASMLLSTLGVESVLVSALPTTSILPKAHVLNQRAMEILSEAGVADAVYARSTPAGHMQATAWYAGLAGSQPDCGRRIARMEAWGAGGRDPHWAAASSCRSANLPQIRLEPILRARAEALAPGRVRFHHELVDLAQDAEGVSALLLDRSADRPYRVRARYLLACDGGRTVGPKLGVTLEGQRNLASEVSIHMTVRGAKRPGTWRGSGRFPSTRSGSGTWTVSTATRAAAGFGSGRSRRAAPCWCGRTASSRGGAWAPPRTPPPRSATPSRGSWAAHGEPRERDAPPPHRRPPAPGAPGLGRLLAFAKPGHVLFGSEWPYAPALAVDYFTAQLGAYDALDADGHGAIDRRIAAALLPRFT